MIYEYQALDKKGETITDFIDANSEIAARQKLRSQGLYVVRIYVQKENRKKTEGNQNFAKDAMGRISDYINSRGSQKQISIFSRQLATLLHAGFPLVTALNDIIEQTDNPTFKKIMINIREKVEEGSSFSHALLKHKAYFSDMYINMVHVGENLGSLDQVVARLADIEEKKSLMRSKIQSALIYPIFMITFSLAAVIFIMSFIIPKITDIYSDMGAELPLITKIVIAASTFLGHFWWLLIILIIAAIIAFSKYKETENGRIKVDTYKMKIPYYKTLYQNMLVLNFTQNLGVMLDNKVDILKSFEIVKKLVNNKIIETKIEEAALKIKEGAKISTSLAKGDFLPKMVIGMIAAGEASDKLDTMLIRIGEVYETELDLKISGLTNLLEPVIILFMGVIIGIIIISVLLPIFQMNLNIQ